MVETAKLASIFIIFGLSVFSGVIPCVTVRCLVRKHGSSTKFKRVINILNCFSGGVFFATSVLHLLPEARESMEQALEGYNFSTEYPLTELIMSIGFFLILAYEHIAHSFCSRNRTHPNREENKVQKEDCSNVHMSISGSTHKDAAVSCNIVMDRINEGVATENHILGKSNLEDSPYNNDKTFQKNGTVDESLDNSSIDPSGIRRDSVALNLREDGFQDSDRVRVNTANVIKETQNQSTRDALETNRYSLNEDPARSRLRGLVLLIALSLHMIFDGLALGLLKDNPTVWELLAAISLHKVLVFFTIGMQTLEILASLRKTVLVIVFFALVSPCGIIIGESITLSGESVAKDMSSAILQGVATGTFLFVTFFEILLRELGRGDHDLLKVFMTVLGFALVASTRLLEH